MPSTQQLRSRLIKKLSELFQLDQPDLDFGFYRIMHAKAQEVQDFIGTDLLKIVADAFGDVDEARKTELKAKIDKEIEAAREYGVADPENSPKVKEAQAAYEALKDTASAEADVYDHLYRFFERYYDDGDFISRRYYTRETSGKAAPFAVPYNGEEVKLHWANADQYYIKSAEYFSNFTFDLRQAQEIRALRQQNQIGILLGDEDDSPIKVHFRVVEATEGEHGNVKASEANKRFFILHAENPVALTETGELVVNFEYRPDPKKTGQENTWRDKRNTEAVETILERLQAMAAAGGEHEEQVAEYLRLFKVPAPTDSDKKRPVLAKYVNQYTARNTMDYFIHKDLGGFLRRELDFYIKNEVMRLDDIENAEAPAVESYLAKIKVLRKIAAKLIDFLAQLEDFQKKLWLKKKFVIETNYCITLDRVPEELYPEIAENEAQIDEWVKLFAIDEIGASHEDTKAQSGDLFDKGIVPFSRPLTVEFLKANNKLVLDTRFFDLPAEASAQAGDSFKARLLASIENFDEQCDGLLIHSENFQALNLLSDRYRGQIQCLYADPPYNAKSSEIIYKNSYKHSSWISLMADRLSAAAKLKATEGALITAIDENEHANLSQLFRCMFSLFENDCISIVHNPAGVQGDNFSYSHEYAIFTFEKRKNLIGKTKRDEDSEEAFRDWGGTSARSLARNCFYPIIVKDGKIVGFGDVCPDDYHPNAPNISHGDEIYVYPVAEDGEERKWVFARDSVEKIFGELNVRERKGQISITRTKSITSYKTVWAGNKYYANIYGSKLLNNIFGEKRFDFPKSLYTVQECLFAVEAFRRKDSLSLDYFAGSGTTGHAVISCNRQDNGKRKVILIEMGDHFDNVVKPRTQKVIYSSEWKDGKPSSRSSGISHCFKYIRLESYEDTLNNLRVDHNPHRKMAVAANPALKEDYMLRYLLDVETRGSQSLLNIDAFADPTVYTLDVKKPGTDEYATRAVDLIETFNYLIGLRVVHYAAPQEFTAKFKRVEDPEVPTDQKTKLVLDGKMQQLRDFASSRAEKSWWFRKVEGWVPKDPANPNNGQREKVLVVWRKLLGDIEQDNLMLDEWFQKNRISTRDFEFDTIYVNGSNNLPNLKLDDENWKVRLIEEEFMKRMWEMEQ
ncbi:DNA methyltransferase [Desulfurispira natronophila]|uniref:Adenine-specific DNA-methyltransferase n=1 Tax=Desulfurispira natronophila TaxID=682562 RepID=A0A7W8DGF7_9BACT|nr:DNA methyltransferase [Desulfurispira natronophila]MBB5021362.1 adenine-specific DNA-methyltransferase [Desulfurispira natronophila]